MRLLGIILFASITTSAFSVSAESPAREPCEPARNLQEFYARIRQAEIWSGGPGGQERYEEVGRKSFTTAILSGLMPDHRVLDIGAGSLRVGWWILQFIDTANYYAIEPNRKMIEGATEVLCADLNVAYNEDFEFPNETFDFVMARSIWTHASKQMIARMLSEFAEKASPDATFLTSVKFPDATHRDYMGSEWKGKSKSSDRHYMVRHSIEWIGSECAKNGLRVEVGEMLYGQTWLRIRRDDAPPAEG